MSRRPSARQCRRTTTSVVLSRLHDRAEYEQQDQQKGLGPVERTTGPRPFRVPPVRRP
jgi:hypothetical protein